MKMKRALMLLAAVSTATLAASPWDRTPIRPIDPQLVTQYASQNIAVMEHWWLDGAGQKTGQYADVYYNNRFGGFTEELIKNTRCIFAHYHGSGWRGSDPRHSDLPGDTVIPTLVNYFVKTENCIVMMPSYPLAAFGADDSLQPMYDHDGNLIANFSIHDILGDYGPNRTGRTGSVFHTFDLFYQQYFTQWNALRQQFGVHEPLKLFVGGESAGAYIAQRLATDGRWPVEMSVVGGQFVHNPYSTNKDPAVISELNELPDGFQCRQQYNVNQCKAYRQLYGAYRGEYNSLDLHHYNGNNPLLTTYYVTNICDTLTEVGPALVGWFDTLPKERKKLLIHKGIANPSNPGENLEGHSVFSQMYANLLTATAANWQNNWIVNTHASGADPVYTPTAGEKYGAACAAERASPNLMGRIRN